MRVVVVTEHRFQRTPQGHALTTGPFSYSFWKRYLTVFDGVLIAARSAMEKSPPTGAARADGPGVDLFPLPDYRGPRQFLERAHDLRVALFGAFSGNDAIILRLPSALACLTAGWLRRARRPYGVEMVGDPWGALGPGAIRHPLRPVFRRVLARSQRLQCAQSTASLYVTRQALQRRYPPPAGGFTVGCSDVELPRSAFVDKPRAARPSPHPTVLTVGSLSHLYKGQDVLLDAASRCARAGIQLRMAIAGDGQYRGALEAQARRLGIADRVLFHGHLPFGEAVRQELDRADLFALPSRQEGLPRALLEAMARGLPAIGSTVGGIPELLAPEDLVPPDDAVTLARKLSEVLRDPARLERMSAANLAKANEYEETQLGQTRDLFLEQLCAETNRHFRAGNGVTAAASRPAPISKAAFGQSRSKGGGIAV